MEAVNEYFEDQNKEFYFKGLKSWSTGGQSANVEADYIEK
jgi:hypothetical protein